MILFELHVWLPRHAYDALRAMAAACPSQTTLRSDSFTIEGPTPETRRVCAEISEHMVGSWKIIETAQPSRQAPLARVVAFDAAGRR